MFCLMLQPPWQDALHFQLGLPSYLRVNAVQKLFHLKLKARRPEACFYRPDRCSVDPQWRSREIRLRSQGSL